MASKFQELLKNTSAWYMIMAITASAINMLSLIIFGRIFSVEDYAVVVTMQAFVTNAAVVVTPLQIMLCKTIAKNADMREKPIDSQVSILLVVNALEAVCMVILAVPIAQYLNFIGVIEYVLFAALIFSNNLYIVTNGIIQGKQDFMLLGWTGIVLYGVKMLLGTLLGLMGLGPMAVIIGYATAEMVCLVIILSRLARVMRGRLKHFQFHLKKDSMKDYVWTLALYIIVSMYMNNGDLLLGNLYCSKADIGLYSVAITLAKLSVFLIATPIATLLLPKVAEKKSAPAQQKKLLAISELITLVLSLLYALSLCVVGNWLIELLYGTDYRGAAQYILPCVIFSTILCLFWVFYQYVMATDLLKLFTCATMLFGTATVVILLLLKPAIGWIPLIMAVAMCLSLITVWVVNIIKQNRDNFGC